MKKMKMFPLLAIASTSILATHGHCENTHIIFGMNSIGNDDFPQGGAPNPNGAGARESDTMNGTINAHEHGGGSGCITTEQNDIDLGGRGATSLVGPGTELGAGSA